MSKFNLFGLFVLMVGLLVCYELTRLCGMGVLFTHAIIQMVHGVMQLVKR